MTGSSLQETDSHARIVLASDEACLDAPQLNLLEQSFRDWVTRSKGPVIRQSRKRILLLFLIIRYTGAKLNEVLALHPDTDLDVVRHVIFFRNDVTPSHPDFREVQMSARLSDELNAIMNDPDIYPLKKNLFQVDPGFVRRKFYERAEACGFEKKFCGPEMIRKARAVEMMRGNMPLPAVQKMLGHKTPNLTSAYVTFSEDDIRQVAKHFMEREARRKTSARNTFFGKIHIIEKGDIQTRVELITMDGHPISTVITNTSMKRLGLKTGRLITAEVKAPGVMIVDGNTTPVSSAENQLKGEVISVSRGKINTECTVRISEETDVCAIISTSSAHHLQIEKGRKVWVMFNAYSVVLHVDL